MEDNAFGWRTLKKKDFLGFFLTAYLMMGSPYILDLDAIQSKIAFD